MSEPAHPSVAEHVLEHTQSTGHSVIWDTEGSLDDAHCQQCAWPNE